MQALTYLSKTTMQAIVISIMREYVSTLTSVDQQIGRIDRHLTNVRNAISIWILIVVLRFS